MSRRRTLKKASVLAARVGAAGAVGWALASLGSGESSAHLEFYEPAHVGHYLYGNSGCTPNSQGEGSGDPINVVFWRPYGNLYESEAMGWVRYFAGFDDGYGADKWFLDHGYCRYMHGQNGTEDGRLPVDRYHARYLDPFGVGWVLAPTHFEEQEWTTSCGPINTGGHAVPDEEDYFGLPWTGFLEGRQRIVDTFSTLQNFSVSYEWWGNSNTRRQCDNGEPWSDGWVAYVEGPFGGGGGGGGGGGCARVSPCL